MTKVRVLNYGALALLVVFAAFEVRSSPTQPILAMICGGFITACAWWLGVSFGRALQAECDSDAVYKREFRRLIAREKQRNPSLSPFIDQQTIAAGHGVIDAEG